MIGNQMYDEEPSFGLGDSFASSMNMNSNMIKNAFNPTADSCMASPETIFSHKSYLTSGHDLIGSIVSKMEYDVSYPNEKPTILESGVLFHAPREHLNP
mgnify:CR=1 FL=1